MFDIIAEHEIVYGGRTVAYLAHGINATMYDRVAGELLSAKTEEEIADEIESAVKTREAELDETIKEITAERDEAIAERDRAWKLLAEIDNGMTAFELIENMRMEIADWKKIAEDNRAAYNAATAPKPRKRR